MLSPIKKLLFVYFGGGGRRGGGRVLLLNAWFPKGIYHQLLTTHAHTHRLRLRLSNIKVVAKSSQTQDTVSWPLVVGENRGQQGPWGTAVM